MPILSDFGASGLVRIISLTPLNDLIPGLNQNPVSFRGQASITAIIALFMEHKITGTVKQRHSNGDDYLAIDYVKPAKPAIRQPAPISPKLKAALKWR